MTFTFFHNLGFENLRNTAEKTGDFIKDNPVLSLLCVSSAVSLYKICKNPSSLSDAAFFFALISELPLRGENTIDMVPGSITGVNF